MTLSIGKCYMMYGKMGSMRRFKPVAGGSFVTNRMHGEMYSPTTNDDIIKLKRELAFVQTQGEFEFREC